MELGELLMRFRLARGMSQRDLAVAAGSAVRSIGDIERGRVRRPQRRTLTALAGALRLSGDEHDQLLQAGRRAPLRSRRRVPADSVIGRDADQARIVRLLTVDGARLVTLVGPAGVGKTCVAMAVLTRLGVDPISIGVDALAARPAADGADLALVDDLDAVDAGTLSAVLTRHPRLRVLVTARAPARLRGEHLWPLDGLAVGAAAALLVVRAGTLRPGFARTPRNADSLDAMCARVNGNPQGVEIIAALLRARECRDLADELNPILSRSDDPVAALVRWRIGRLAHPTRAALAELAGYPLGVAAVELPGIRSWDGPIAELAGAAILQVTDRAGQAWLRVPGAVRDGIGTGGCT